MRRNRILFLVIALTLTFALAAMAQGAGRMGGQGARGAGQQALGPAPFGGPQFLVRYLELTEAQIGQWKTIQEGVRTQAATLLGPHKANTLKIREQLESTAPSAAVIGQLVIDNHKIGEQLRVFHEAAQAQFVLILNPGQKVKYDNFLELLKAMPRRGPGGQGLGDGTGAGMGMGGFGFGGGFGPPDGNCPWCED